MNFSKILGAIVAGLGLLATALVAFKNNDNYENMSDDELMEEREKARLAHCSGDEEGTRILDIIDNILRKRDTSEPSPHADPNFRWTDANRWDKD